MYVGTRLNVSSTVNLSWVSKFGKNCASTSNDVAASMLSTNSTYDAGTSSPNANWSATRKPMFDPRRRTRSTSSGASARPAISRGPTWPPRESGISLLMMRCVLRPPAVVDTSATPATRCSNDVGVPLGVGHDRHAAHRVPDQHDLAVGCHLAQHPLDVVAELVDRRVLVVGATRPAVRALVVEHEAVLAAEVLALEVPAVEVERVAVHEDDRRLGLRTAGAAARSPCWAGSSSPRCTARPRRSRRGGGRRRRCEPPSRDRAARRARRRRSSPPCAPSRCVARRRRPQ